MTASPASPARNADTTRPCECSYWENEDQTAKLTDCTRQTNSVKKLFLPGHDAKLKGALIRAKLANEAVNDGRGVTGDPVALAARFGFGPMVANAQPKAKKAAKAPTTLAEVVAAEEQAAEAKEIAKDEAEAVAKVRASAAPRRTRKAAPAKV